MGFPFADVEDAGVSVLVTVDGDEQLAIHKADEVAGWLWSARDELQPTLTTIEEVIRFVNEDSGYGLTIFADGSDNPGGGGEHGPHRDNRHAEPAAHAAEQKPPWSARAVGRSVIVRASPP